MTPELLYFDLLGAPLAAGMLVLATHVPLGIDVLRRGILFVDLAVAQVAVLGVILAGLLGFNDSSGWVMQLTAGAAALIGALILTWTDRRWPEVQEALIGLLFVLSAAAGILLLAGNPQGGEQFRDLLAGQILWVRWDQLWPVALLYGVLLTFWFGRLSTPDGSSRAGFYILFALMVTASVQLPGVLLVFASLIAPAIATRHLSGRRSRLWLAYAIGAGSYAGGLLSSLVFDLPAGAAVACVLCLVAFAALEGFRR